MKKIKKEIIIIYILCFLLLFAGLFLALGMRNAKQCLGNPFLYGVNKITNEDTGNLYCNCYFESFDYAPFSFDRDSLHIGD